LASAVKQVFISYATEDTDFAHRLADDLKRLGARVWIAPESIPPGESWVDGIERGLRESSHVVMVLTPAALEASGAKMERDMAIALALQDRIKVISLRLKPCEVPLVLSRYQMILAFQEDYDAGLNQLASQLGLRAAPPGGIGTPRPIERRLPGLPLLALAGLLVLVICVAVIGLVVIGVTGGPGVRIPILTTPAPVVVETPISTPTLPPKTTPNETQLPPSPSSTPVIVVVTATPLPPTATPTLAPRTDTPTPVPPTPTPVPPTPTSQPPTPTPAVREKDGMEMVYVPGGTFEMGSTDAEVEAVFEQCKPGRGSGDCERIWLERESPRHSVTLGSFWIDQTEVTNLQYARCVADGTCSPPAKLGSQTRDSYYGDSQFDDYPVIYVSWHDATTYCEWAGGRLPTEAEWEYAARGPDGNVYPWGNDPPHDSLLNYGWNVGDTTKVGSYPDGASWVGAMDMTGNVWEWVSDWYAEYAASSAEDPTGPDTGHEKVQRGGSWETPPYDVRSATRALLPDDRPRIGFRCVVEPGN
jgi:formylglycine-generating enzyme required for sulfatase activity